MQPQLLDRVWQILVCPCCGGPLIRKGNGATCGDCREDYGCTESSQLDLRLRRIKWAHLKCELGNYEKMGMGFDPGVLDGNPLPEVDYKGIRPPVHLTKELLSYFPRARSADSLVLDLGCGESIHRGVCERAGFNYVGLDYDSREAQILGDAHALPFKSDSFEFVLSVAVLEHIRYPLVMMEETYRVLKPGGKFIGTVAFLEPFHADSFYHHTHLGAFNSLAHAGFSVEKIAPSARWSVLQAQARMILFPRLPRIISTSLVMPLYVSHRLWWLSARLLGKGSEKQRVLRTTGAFSFIANKPTS